MRQPAVYDLCGVESSADQDAQTGVPLILPICLLSMRLHTYVPCFPVAYVRQKYLLGHETFLNKPLLF